MNDLIGPTNDVAAMKRLLLNPMGFALPNQNVCVLENGEATRQSVLDALDSFIVDNVDQGDEAIFYFAGHGSQVPDLDQDEPDTMDETLVLHDGKRSGEGQISDDELNLILRRISQRGAYTSLLLDSCTSGSGYRDLGGEARSRFLDPAPRGTSLVSDTPRLTPTNVDVTGEGQGGLFDRSIPGLMAFTSTTDGTKAYEIQGKGLFTQALVGALRESPGPLTWRQVSAKVNNRMPKQFDQHPSVQGEVSRLVFSAEGPRSIAGWQIRAKGQTITLAGPPLPGWTKGAELRFYSGAADIKTLADPSAAKGQGVLVETFDGGGLVEAPAAVVERLEVGDVAVLHSPGDASKVVTYSFAEGFSKTEGFEQGMSEWSQSELIQEVHRGGVYTVIETLDGQNAVLGPEGQVLGYLPIDGQGPELSNFLERMLTQQHVLSAYGNNNDDGLLKLEIVPQAQGSACARGQWPDGELAGVFSIPLCHRYKVRLSLNSSLGKGDHWARDGVYVGLLGLYADGTTFGFPEHNELIKLMPGELVDLPRGQSFMAQPPGEVVEYLMAIATPLNQPIGWSRYTAGSPLRQLGQEKAPSRSGETWLNRTFLRGRGASLVSDDPTVLYSEAALGIKSDGVLSQEERDLWLVSIKPITVRQYPSDPGTPVQGVQSGGSRELTLQDYDISPHLPLTAGALSKVLHSADSLVTQEIPFKMHDWSAPTVQENLLRGIDCSRFIWRTFLDAGLPYTSGNAYAYTGLMAKGDGPMSTHFTRCDDVPLQAGDVLVYRDEAKGAGHTVMVIDPTESVAVGSHGFDSGPQPEGLPDVGAEYQRLKSAKDWESWDRSDMRRVACWRHTAFEAEEQAPLQKQAYRWCEDLCLK